MKTLQKMKKDKKGFTLVEIIVVLVILAILAALTIPAMTGFISDANDKAYIAEARAAYVAAQSYASEQKGAGTAVATVAGNIDGKLATTTAEDNSKLCKLLDGSYTTGAVISATAVEDKTYKVTTLTYTVKKKVIVITPGSPISVSDAAE